MQIPGRGGSMRRRSWIGSAVAAASAPCRDWWRALQYDFFVRRSGLPIYRVPAAERIAAELAYVDVLRRLGEEHGWLPTSLFPVGGAATHSFLAILVRALVECRFTRVLELGAGQTTRVLSAWSMASGAKVWTIENDPGWVEAVRSAIVSPHHQLVHALLRRDVEGHSWYDFEAIRSHVGDERIDLIVVDGPLGTPRWSRVGVVPRFAELRADEWVVMWDDLQRRGDLESFAHFVHVLRSAGVPHQVASCQAARTLGLAFSPGYARVKSFC